MIKLCITIKTGCRYGFQSFFINKFFWWAACQAPMLNLIQKISGTIQQNGCFLAFSDDNNSPLTMKSGTFEKNKPDEDLDIDGNLIMKS